MCPDAIHDPLPPQDQRIRLADDRILARAAEISFDSVPAAAVVVVAAEEQEEDVEAGEAALASFPFHHCSCYYLWE